jgi:acetoin:2,6-dichlorophenolindophenol oxidoreductase subunit beta
MREITYAEAIREALCEEMRRDSRVIFMGEDIGVYGGAFGVSRGLIEEFGESRVRDTPISEAVLVGAAAGAAMTGLRPIAELMFSDFMTLAMDQLVNQAAKNRFQFGAQAAVPMVLRMPEGSGTGAAGQHSQSLEAWCCHVPGLKVIAPSTPYDAKGLLKAAVRDNNPVVFFEQKLLYRTVGPVPGPDLSEDHIVPIGKADTKRTGRDLSIITYGRMVTESLKAAEQLAGIGIEAEILDLRTLVPLDREAVIASAKKTGRVLIVHEAVKTGGYGGEIAAVIADSPAFFYLDAPIKRLCGMDVPIPYNPGLEAGVVPSSGSIYAAALDLMEQRNAITGGPNHG